MLTSLAPTSNYTDPEGSRIVVERAIDQLTEEQIAKFKAEFHSHFLYHFDIDGNGIVDFQDYLTDRMKEITDFFRFLDQDGNGHVKSEELRHVMTNGMTNVTNEDVDEKFRKSDIDEDGQVNFEEFVTAIQAEDKKEEDEEEEEDKEEVEDEEKEDEEKEGEEKEDEEKEDEEKEDEENFYWQ